MIATEASENAEHSTVDIQCCRSAAPPEDLRLRSSIDVSGAVASEEDASRPRMRAAVRWLGLWFLAEILFILAATRIKAISSYAFRPGRCLRRG